MTFVNNFLGKKIIIKNIVLNLIGKHNILNSVAAIVVCLNLGIKIKIIKRCVIKIYRCPKENDQRYLKKTKIKFYDDYAHHPTEIHSVLQGIRNVANKKK